MRNALCPSTPPRKRAVPRTTSPEWTERDQEWAQQARAFMESEAEQFFVMNSEQPNYYTAAEVLGWLDGRSDLPAPYARFLSDYDVRYQWTSSMLERFLRAGKVEVGSTVNARGREARCYRAARAPVAYSVEAEGPNKDQIEAAVADWLRQNPRA